MRQRVRSFKGSKMTKPIPLYIDEVLREWDTIAYLAYDGYEQQGPGVVGIIPGGNSSVLFYGTCDFFVKQGNTTVLRMIDEYDPDWEFLALFDTDDGNTRTLRIRTPEGGRRPKRVCSLRCYAELMTNLNHYRKNYPGGSWIFWRR